MTILISSNSKSLGKCSDYLKMRHRRGGHSTVLAYLLPDQPVQVHFPAFQKFFQRKKDVNVFEAYQQRNGFENID